MTMKNAPITIGFASITATQLAVGLCQLTLSAEGGGKARALGSKYCSHPLRTVVIASLQPTLFHRYPLTHTTSAYSTGIGLWR